MEGKWLIADRDLNEREGIKWLLKTSSIPVTNIGVASNYREFVVKFEQEKPDVVLIELDMISKEDWSTFRDLMHIYDPVLLLTSAEGTFEKARLAIDMQALDLMIKPLSPTKVTSAFHTAARKLGAKNQADGRLIPKSYKDISYEALFISQSSEPVNFQIAAFQTESIGKLSSLHSFIKEFPFKGVQGIFAMDDMVVSLFKETDHDLKEQCQKAMRKWEEEFSDPLAIVVHQGNSSAMSLNQKYLQTRKMLEFTYYKGYRQVVEFEQSPEWIHIDPFLAPPEQRAWVDMLANADLEKIKKWLYKEFLQLHEPFPDPGLVRIQLTSILAQVRRFMKTKNLDENQSYELEYRYIFNSILYDKVLYRTVQNFILFIQKLFIGAANSTRNKQDPIERGISFMETHFSNSSLRLEDVALYVDRNPSYFSHMMNIKTGSSFTEVLTAIRMKEAKRLLIETNKSINEISNLTGYQNSNYFSRMFKELVGNSPREFRMNKVKMYKSEKEAD